MPSGPKRRSAISSSIVEPVTRSRQAPTIFHPSFEYQNRSPGAVVGGNCRASQSAPWSVGARCRRETGRVAPDGRVISPNGSGAEPWRDLVHADVQVEAAGRGLLHRDDAGERLGDRSDLEPSLGPHRRAGGHVGHAADRDAEDLLTVGDREDRAGGVRGLEVVLEGRPDAVECLLQTGHVGWSAVRPRRTARARAADSESRCCTMFSPISVAKSP
jgi:hypothetical protein